MTLAISGWAMTIRDAAWGRRNDSDLSRGTWIVRRITGSLARVWARAGAAGTRPAVVASSRNSAPNVVRDIGLSLVMVYPIAPMPAAAACGLAAPAALLRAGAGGGGAEPRGLAPRLEGSPSMIWIDE